ncbi:MAG: putative ABC transporter, auxiliary component, ATP-dependent toluene efflux transporter [Anaerolineales bacterium]|nr:putative ABC transporter, auxiliary component, ATP-dependent toluene efflux transporter [Anaerolineales bacterium]
MLAVNPVTISQPQQDRQQHAWTRVLRPVVVVVGFWLGVAQPAWATSPTATLEAFFSRTNTILATVDPAHGLETPRQAIRALTNDVFDFRAAAAVALGSVWLSRVPEDQDEFTRLFAIFLERGFVAVVGSKASMAGGVNIQYLGESIDGESAGVATTLLTRAGQELPVDYWMIRRGDRWKVQDVVVDGVSLVMNYRAQFARVLATYPYADLVARMRTEAPSEPPPAASLAAQSAPSTAPAAGGAQLSPAVVRDAPADPSAKPKVIKPGQPEQQIPKSKSVGTKRKMPSGAEPSSPVPVAARAAAPSDTQQPVDVVGRLLVKSRSGAERDVAALLAQAGGATLSRQRGPTITVVKAVVPHSRYGNFAAGLRGIGSWQLEAERSPLPNVLHVTVRLAE